MTDVSKIREDLDEIQASVQSLKNFADSLEARQERKEDDDLDEVTIAAVKVSEIVDAHFEAEEERFAETVSRIKDILGPLYEKLEAEADE